MAELRIGTCSWKYDSWRGLIYSSRKPINYLQEYARHFNTVEIDQWFWSLFGTDKVSLPRPAVVAEYLASVPADFKFTIKIPNSITLTHFYRKQKSEPLQPNPYFFSPKLFAQFLQRIAPMKPQLGPLMFQFEYLNKQKMPSLAEFLRRMEAFLGQIDRSYPYAVEIRNPNYLKQEYFQFLKDQGLRVVLMQGYYMPSIVDIYRKFSQWLEGTVVIRLHGGDRQEIEEKSGGHWNQIYEPRDVELEEVARMIDELLARGVHVYVNVNNHYEGSAPLTIRRLAERLKQLGTLERSDVPALPELKLDD
ncbi:MAG: DUF72 domain-containing protein [Calditrichaeota bacterium]|nr:MAG: DUF72 domain-containing protein [Calditrichota bacterium]